MIKRLAIILFFSAIVILSGQVSAAPSAWPRASVDLRWNVRIPLRDGVELAATAYLPKGAEPRPCVFTLTPYIAVTYHDRGKWFAERGLPFLSVDVRGRGNSGGEFNPNLQEANDGHDVVEWLARQPYCNGKVSMWGGSYAGYNQWAAAGQLPRHLATIVPVAAPYIGVDFPISRGMIDPYGRQWAMFTAGKASQQAMFGDHAFWADMLRERQERGGANREIVDLFGVRHPILAKWFERREDAVFWASYNPSSSALSKLEIPVLTLTGSYDADQPGAIAHYRAHLAAAPPRARDRHYLVIGPWDHPGTRTPQLTFGGLTVGEASLVDLPQLHLDWYRWTMAGGERPSFLKDRVAWYLIGADQWRYSPSLEAVTARQLKLKLGSNGAATDLFASGVLGASGTASSDSYRYDPANTRNAAMETDPNTTNIDDGRMVIAQSGEQLVYTSAPFDKPTDIAGFFRLKAWITIDQPDTSFRASVYAVMPDGKQIYLSADRMRARYRENDFSPRLVTPGQTLLYDFDRFMFTTRRMPPGSRLRLVIDPMNSIYAEKNYNSGKRPEDETIADARVVTVTLHHDPRRPSELFVPLAQ